MVYPNRYHGPSGTPDSSRSKTDREPSVGTIKDFALIHGLVHAFSRLCPNCLGVPAHAPNPHQGTLIPVIPFWEVIFLKLSQIVYLFLPRTNYYSRQQLGLPRRTWRLDDATSAP